MRQYQCECQECGERYRVVIKQPPYPEIGELFKWRCPKCDKETDHMRVEPIRLDA